MKRYEQDTEIRRMSGAAFLTELEAETTSPARLRLNRMLEALTQWGLGALLLLSVHWPIHGLLHSGVRPGQLLAVAMLAWTGVSLLLGTKIGRGVLVGVAVLGAILLGNALLSDTDVQKSLSWVLEQLYAISVHLYWFEPIVGTTLEGWLPPLDAALATLEATLLFLLAFRRLRFWLLASAGIAAHLTGLAVSGLTHRFAFLLFLGLLTLGYIRFVAEKRRRAGVAHEQPAMGRLLLQAIPIVLIPVLAVSLIPKQDAPLQWPWLDARISAWTLAFEERFIRTDTEFFNLGAAGFTGRTQRLGGRIRPGGTVVMDVTTENRTYLRGAAYSDWLGDSWSQEQPEDVFLPSEPGSEVVGESGPGGNAVGIDGTVLPVDAARFGDSNVMQLDLSETRGGWAEIPVEVLFPDADEADRELLTALRDGSLVPLLFPAYDMTIQYRNLTTRSVFVPLKTQLPLRIGAEGVLNLAQNAHGIGLADQKLPFGSQYALTYAQPMYGDPMLQRALTLSRGGLYEDALRRLYGGRSMAFAPAGTARGRLGQLSRRASQVRETYTRLPETIPSRVRELARSITDGEDTDYARATAIEEWLSGSFPYTLDPGRLPEGEDFVDHFLFDEQQGYCTYFASAMVVMLREIGIPARYVEGYVLPDNGGDSNAFQVTNRNAHAWPEVYFEGFGWMQFEPTPGFAGITEYLIEQDAEEAFAGGGIPDDIQEMIERYRYGDAGGSEGYVPSPVPSVQGGALRWIVPLAAVFAVLLLYPLGEGISRIQEALLRRRARKARILHGYVRALRWLSHAGLTLRPGETLQEFSQRISDAYYLDRMPAGRMTELYMRVLYGDKEPGHEESVSFEIALEDLKRQVLRDLGLRRWIPLRVVILGI